MIILIDYFVSASVIFTSLSVRPGPAEAVPSPEARVLISTQAPHIRCCTTQNMNGCGTLTLSALLSRQGTLYRSLCRPLLCIARPCSVRETYLACTTTRVTHHKSLDKAVCIRCAALQKFEIENLFEITKGFGHFWHF